MNRVVGDHMGMLATVMNVKQQCAMRFIVRMWTKINVCVPIKWDLRYLGNWSEAIKMLREKRVVISPAGTGARSLLQILLHAYMVLKLKRISC